MSSRNLQHKTRGGFKHFARAAARVAGGSTAFALALLIIISWAITGPIFHFNNAWQLVINTVTNVVTLLMVFLIQNTQNRDSEAMQIKLDELLRATKGCHNAVMDIEELSEEELDQIKRRYTALAQKAILELRRGNPDVDAPEVEEKPIERLATKRQRKG
jgi:low affinity Fe/Cu permease